MSLRTKLNSLLSAGVMMGNISQSLPLDVEQSTKTEATERRRVLIASVVGSVFEWYDFIIYGIASALIFNTLFFPNSTPLVGTIAAFGTYAAGYAARPLGGIVFGHFGDRLGRKAMLSLTLMIMGVGTFLVGCLPTFTQIGIWAPILLIALRFLQGLGIGGEWAGSVLMAVEHAPSNRRGLYGSLVQLGYPIGVIAATAAFSLVGMLPKEDFLSWGWRLPFLISIFFTGAGLYIRNRVSESAIFQRASQEPHPEKIPLVEILTQHRRSFLIAIGLKVSEISWVSVLTIFGLSYVTVNLGLPRSVILNGMLCAAALELVTIPLFGLLSDIYGRKKLFIAGCVFTILFAFPLFQLLDTRDPMIIAGTIAIAVSFGQGIMFGPEAAWMSELFQTRLRYSGASLGFQLGGAISGGLTPIITALLISWAGGLTWSVSVYLICTACITLVAASMAPETAGKSLKE
ncbi:MFS transporter [Pseudomonas sp. RC10]|uniref:MFS transporter n=1 Tax=Pseudomonas bambusae TaxID=3139142 RepID=UPI003139456B